MLRRDAPGTRWGSLFLVLQLWATFSSFPPQERSRERPSVGISHLYKWRYRMRARRETLWVPVLCASQKFWAGPHFPHALLPRHCYEDNGTKYFTSCNGQWLAYPTCPVCVGFSCDCHPEWCGNFFFPKNRFQREVNYQRLDANFCVVRPHVSPKHTALRSKEPHRATWLTARFRFLPREEMFAKIKGNS